MINLPRSENFEDVEFTTAGGPAGAISSNVLTSARNLSVEHPDGRHISVHTRGATIRGHLELEQEDLLRTIETV